MVSVFGERWHCILNSCCKILFLQFQRAVLLGSVEGAEGWLLVLLNPALPNPHTRARWEKPLNLINFSLAKPLNLINFSMALLAKYCIEMLLLCHCFETILA